MSGLFYIDHDERYPDYFAQPPASSGYGQANAYLTDEESAFVTKAFRDYNEAQHILLAALGRGLA